eukprot:1273362-Pyramimonas_sp.AAC.1
MLSYYGRRTCRIERVHINVAYILYAHKRDEGSVKAPAQHPHTARSAMDNVWPTSTVRRARYESTYAHAAAKPVPGAS